LCLGLGHTVGGDGGGDGAHQGEGFRCGGHGFFRSSLRFEKLGDVVSTPLNQI
jgi:hypothetical protein